MKKPKQKFLILLIIFVFSANITGLSSDNNLTGTKSEIPKVSSLWSNPVIIGKFDTFPSEVKIDNIREVFVINE